MREYSEIFNQDFVYLRNFLRTVERDPWRNALTCTAQGLTWSYEQLNAESNRLAAAVQRDGLVRGDVVMTMLLNTPEYVFCWIGLQKAGVVFSPINFRLAPAEVASHIEDSRPKAFIFDASVKDVVLEALELLKDRPEILVMTGEEKTPSEGVLSYRDYVQSVPANEVYPEGMGPFEEIVRLYTSGTTGSPKGVPLNNINNVLRSYDVLMHFPLGPGDKTMNMSPWFHAGGLHSGGPCPTLHAGGEVFALKVFAPRQVLDLVQEHGLTFLIGAPANLEMLAAAQAQSPRDLSSLKGIVTMGAPLSREACLRYQEVLTPNIFNGYGTTETFWNTFLRPYDLPAKAGTAGRPCTDDQVRVVRIYEEKVHAEPDDYVPRNGSEEGEVIIRTLKAPYRYFNKPEEDEKHYYQGWYYTNDIATWDEKGFITICGRKDDMIISEGENIHPVQVETVINSHPKVRDSFVIGVSDKMRGEAVAAYVIPEDDGLTAQELFQYLTDSPELSRFKRPRYIKFADSLPFTATGKKQYFVLRKQAEEDLANGSLKRP
ncbi:MAG: class I adenylate-forming enzyme family protein [Desulfonatronovibrionaceae bacterium]